MKRHLLLPVLAAALLLSGCSTIKKFTGQRDDSVLPGQREEILPPDQYTAKKDLNKQAQPQTTAPGGTAGSKADAPCNPEVDPECVVPEAGGNDGVFNDG
jgi:PBP1b-binding outer membrane lipoprotein LpoB